MSFTNKVIQYTHIQNGHKLRTTMPVDVFFYRLSLGACSLEYAMEKFKLKNQHLQSLQFTRVY
jgi:hypothetical protein